MVQNEENKDINLMEALKRLPGEIRYKILRGGWSVLKAGADSDFTWVWENDSDNCDPIS